MKNFEQAKKEIFALATNLKKLSRQSHVLFVSDGGCFFGNVCDILEKYNITAEEFVEYFKKVN